MQFSLFLSCIYLKFNGQKILVTQPLHNFTFNFLQISFFNFGFIFLTLVLFFASHFYFITYAISYVLALTKGFVENPKR